MRIDRKYCFYFPAVLAAVSCILFSGCTGFEDNDYDIEDEDEQPAKVMALEATEVHLEDAARHIVVSAILKQDIGGIDLSSDSITVNCEEIGVYGVPYPKKVQPVVSKVTIPTIEQIINNHIYLDVLADLTLSPSAVKAEKKALMQIRQLFPIEHMRVIFLTEQGTSEAMPASDYVIETYCVPSSGSGRKMLYKGLIDCLRMATDTTKMEFKDFKRALVAFSDGRVYSNNRAIDPEHFNHQDELIDLSSKLKSVVSVYYVNFGEAGSSNDAGAFVNNLCNSVGGLYQESFNWLEMKKHIFRQYGIKFSDYAFILTNPNNKIYDGKKHILSLQCIKDKQVVAELQTEYNDGSLYKPVVVNGKSSRQILWLGIVMAIGILAFVYGVLQIAVPKIRKILFDKKYVTTYKRNMSVSGVMVDSTCYYCKAPFEPGDKIVARCCHTMHEQCWNENGYHCPEYGRNCKHGGHYYNPDNLLDPCNASFHMLWVIYATIAGTLSWIVFSLIDQVIAVNIITSLSLKLYKIQVGSPEYSELVETINSLDLYPAFSLFMGFLLTMAISILTVHKRDWPKMSAEILLRSIVGGICGFTFFLIGCIITILVDNKDLTIFIDWIPWTLTGISIALCSSLRTTTKPRRYWIPATIAIGFLSMFLWEIVLARMGVDYRMWLLLSHILFSVAIALCVAQATPASERYFLHVSGAIKDMDIAIYKWFEANSNRVITIGRSVDCDLMMSWDVNGDIAPVQANLSKKGRFVYITPLEDGVMAKGKMLPAGKPFRLCHGTSLTIGKTEMIYQEKDV